MSRWGNLLQGAVGVVKNVASEATNLAAAAVEQGASLLEAADINLQDREYDPDSLEWVAKQAQEEGDRRTDSHDGDDDDDADDLGQRYDHYPPRHQEGPVRPSSPPPAPLSAAAAAGNLQPPHRESVLRVQQRSLISPILQQEQQQAEPRQHPVEVRPSPVLSSRSDVISPLDFNSYGVSVETIMKEKDGEIEKLKKMVDSLKNKKKSDKLRKEMQPQLERLVNLLQDTQTRIRAKDKEIGKMKAQLLGHASLPEGDDLSYSSSNSPPSSSPAPSADKRRLAEGATTAKQIAKMVEELKRLTEARTQVEKERKHALVELEGQRKAWEETQELLMAHQHEKEQLATLLRRAEEQEMEKRAEAEVKAGQAEARAQSALDRVKALESKLREGVKRAEDAEQEMMQWKAKASKLQEAVLEGQESEATGVEEVRRLRLELDETKEELEGMKQGAVGLREVEARAMKAEEKLIELMPQIEELRLALDVKTQELAALQKEKKRMMVLEDEMDNVVKARDEALLKLRELQEQHLHGQGDHQRTLATLEARSQEIETELRRVREERLDEAATLLADAQAKANRLAVQLEQVLDLKAADVAELEVVKARTIELEGQLEKAMKRASASQEASDQLTEALKKAEALEANLEEEVRLRDDQDAELEGIRASSSKLEAELQQLKDLGSKEDGTLKDALIKAEELEKQLKIESETRAGLEQQIKELEAAAVGAKQGDASDGDSPGGSSLQSDYLLEKKISMLQEVEKELRQALEQSSASLAEAEGRIEGLEEETGRIRSEKEMEMKELWTRLEELEAAHLQKIDELKMAQSKAEELQTTLTKQEAEVTSDLQQALSRNKQLEAELQQAVMVNEKLEAAAIEAQHRERQLREELEEMGEAKARTADLEEQLQKALASEADMKTRYEALMEEEGKKDEAVSASLTQEQARLAQLEEELQEAFAPEAELKAKYETLKEETERLTEAETAGLIEAATCTKELEEQLQKALDQMRKLKASEAETRARYEAWKEEAEKKAEAEHAGVSEAQARIRKLEEQLRSNLQQMTQLKASESAARMAGEELRQTIESFQANDDEAAAALQKAEERVKELEHELRAQAARAEAASEEISANGEAEIGRLTQQLMESRKALGDAVASKEAELFRLKKEMDRMQEEVDKAKASEEEAERLRLKRRSDLEELRRLNAHIQTLQSKAANEAAELQAEAEGLRAARAKARHEADGYRSEVEKLRAELVAAREGESQGNNGEIRKQQEREVVTTMDETSSIGANQRVLELQQQYQEQEEQLRNELTNREVEVNKLRKVAEELEAKLVDADKTAEKRAKSQIDTTRELTMRLEAAEIAREQAKREVAQLRNDLASVASAAAGVGTATVIQRGSKAANPSKTNSLNLVISGNDGPDLEGGLEAVPTTPTNRRSQILNRLHPVFDQAMNHARRKFPNEMQFVESKILVYVTHTRLLVAYFVLLHLYVFRLLFRGMPAAT